MIMEPETAFGGTLLRLKEAQNQRKQFHSKWADYLAGVPYEFSLESDTPLDHRLMGHERRAPSADLGLHFGMWLQQQRAALDNALYACTGLRQNSFPPARENLIEFPIAESLRKLRDTRTIKSNVVDLEIAEFLEGHQPYRHYYKGEEQDPHLSPLYWLNELARVDRHRVMHVGVGSMQISRNLFLYGGPEHRVTHVVEEGHLLTSSTCLVAFSTADPLRSRKFRFHQKPQVLPEISEWSQAQWNIYVSGHWDEPDPGYRQGYVPLDVRMSDVEKTVIEICGGLANYSGLNRFFDSVESSVYSRPFDYQQVKYWREDPVERRRINGL